MKAKTWVTKSDAKLKKAIAALKRAEKELLNASSLTVGLGRDCWLQRDAVDLSLQVESIRKAFETFVEEVAR